MSDEIVLDEEFQQNKRINRQTVDEVMTRRFGQAYVEYRNLWRKSGPGYVPEVPIHIDIETIDLCNYKCKYCWRNSETRYVDPEKINTGKKFSVRIFRKILDEVASKGLYSVNFGFSGECLLNDDLVKMVGMARDAGVIDIRIITNGSLLNRDKAYRLVDAGVTFFSISIDACSAETYKKIKGNNNFQKLRENLLLLRELQKDELPLIRTSFYPCPENRDEEEQFVDAFSPLSDFIDIQPFTSPEPDEAAPVAPFCDIPFRRLSIFADGEVAPCCTFFSRKLIVGNVISQTIEEIWNSQKMNCIRDMFVKRKTSGICRTCLSSTR